MNFDSADWKELVDDVNARLVFLDGRNRGALSPEETQKIRGEISALLWVLDWKSRISPPDVATYDIT